MRLAIAVLAGRAFPLAGAALCALPGCAAPGAWPTPGGAPALLYVVSGAGATITRLDAGSRRAVGRPLPTGPAPWRVAPDPAAAAGVSSLLVLSTSAAGTGDLTRLSRVGGGWTAQPVPMAAGARGARLAGDGGRHGAVSYHDTPGDGEAPGRRCRLALVPHRSGAIARRHTVCDGPESVTELALEEGPAGPVAYLGVLGPGPPAAGKGAEQSSATNRIVAVDARTGAVVAARPLAGEPRHLVLATAPGRAGRRLYAVEAPRWAWDDATNATGAGHTAMRTPSASRRRSPGPAGPSG